MNKPNNILTQKQQDFLVAIGEYTSIAELFYFAGGTNLACNHLYHRLSDDLDFFTMQEFDYTIIAQFFLSYKHKLQIVDIQRTKLYDRNIVVVTYKDGEQLKTEFTRYFQPQFPIEIKNKIQIESINDCFLDKLAAVYDRRDPKDFVDIYFMMTQGTCTWDIKNIFFKSKFGYDVSDYNFGVRFFEIAQREYILPKVLVDFDEKHFRNRYKGQSYILGNPKNSIL